MMKTEPFPEWAEEIFASFNDKPHMNGDDRKKGGERGAFSADALGALISRCAASIAPEKIDWLWDGRLARGKHCCIAGEPGTGKSQASIYIAAAITTAGQWPCGEGTASLGSVVILSAEDGAADTIVPRLMAAGADLDRVHIVSAVRNPDGKGQRTFNLRSDIALLERKVAEVGDVALVIIDPVSSYLGKTDSHKNSEVRGVLEPLSDMAERTRLAVLSITHFNKTGSNATTKALHRFIGSIAFTGAPRTAFAVIEDPEDATRRLFLHAKNNLAPPPQGLAFRLEQTIVVDGVIGSRVAWDGEPVTITANQALAAEAANTDRTARDEAKEFLQGALGNGPLAARDLQDAARDHGISVKTLRTAREALKVKISRDGFGPGSKSLWSLATQGSPHDPYLPKDSIDAQQNKWASMNIEGKYGDGAEPENDQSATDDPLNLQAIRDRVRRREAIQTPRVGDWVIMSDGTVRRLSSPLGCSSWVHPGQAWPVDAIPDRKDPSRVTHLSFSTDGSERGQFFLRDNGTAQHSGGNDHHNVSRRAKLIDTGQVQAGKFRAFEMNHPDLGRRGGFHFELPCRVYRLSDNDERPS